MVFGTLSNCESCLIRPSKAKPHHTLQRVGDSLGEATVFGYKPIGSFGLTVSKLTETHIPNYYTFD